MKAKKLFFMECHLAGRQYHDADEVWDELHVGTLLELRRELDNRHDKDIYIDIMLHPDAPPLSRGKAVRPLRLSIQ